MTTKKEETVRLTDADVRRMTTEVWWDPDAPDDPALARARAAKPAVVLRVATTGGWGSPGPGILVVVAKPGARAEKVRIDGSLKAYQELVGGYIELVPGGGGMLFGDRGLHVYVNEDGEGLGLAENAPLVTDGGRVVDRVRGPIVVSRFEFDGGADGEWQDVGLTDAEAAKAMRDLDTHRGLVSR